MLRRVSTIAGLLLLLASAAAAQTPSPDAMMAARKLVITMGTADQYRALLPQLLLKLRPVLSQDRPEVERDFDAMTTTSSDIYAASIAQMIDQIAALYAVNFTPDELRELDAFYARPVGRKLLEKSDALSQASAQIAQDASRKAADDLKQRLSEALRQKGHKL